MSVSRGRRRYGPPLHPADSATDGVRSSQTPLSRDDGPSLPHALALAMKLAVQERIRRGQTDPTMHVVQP